MHELSLCQSIVRMAEACLRKEPGKLRVTRVALEVGDAAAIELEALRFCFPLVAEGGPVEGAALNIETVPVRLRCQGCGCTYSPTPGPTAFAAPCPECDGVLHQLLSGRELNVRHIEVEEITSSPVPGGSDTAMA
ncbi:hydrogenase maturation nickel metallochaperone HypA [Breoghania sp. JC706]|uniref:hydrogenase maturation nickel metallochaperone HypA n=1 Tax=Breoghania sp. JC706 TaxID=3117732 RepID=UPI003009C7A1